MLKHRSVAVDFDNTLGYSSPNEYPYISTVDRWAINICKKYREKGGLLVLWTARAGESLSIAVSELERYGLYFDAINETPKCIIDEWLEKHPNAGISPKVFCDMYIDDRTPEAIKYGLDWELIEREMLAEQ